MNTQNSYKEFLECHPNWVRGFKAIGEDFLHLSDNEKDSFCLMLKNAEFLKNNSIGRPTTLEDLAIKEPSREEIKDIYSKQRELYPEIVETVKQYLKK